MTENKRFKLGRIFYTDENPCLYDNGQPLCEIVANKEEEKVLLEVLNELHEENQTLKAQLLYDGMEGVCNICKHHYLVESEYFYVSKCKKEHEECSKVSLKYCEDFEVMRDYE